MKEKLEKVAYKQFKKDLNNLIIRYTCEYKVISSVNFNDNDLVANLKIDFKGTRRL